MAGEIDKYLSQFNLTRYQVAKVSGVGAPTLAAANEKAVRQMSVRVVQALAMLSHQTPGQTLDALLKIEGNSIMKFIEDHPGLDSETVKKVENQLIEIHEQGGTIKNVTFNRYYDEGEDTLDRAQLVLNNLSVELQRIIDKHSAHEIDLN